MAATFDVTLPRRVPASTYRLQLNHRFTFDDARTLVPYLNALGVTDVYSSPILQARPGSGHGYDICDPTRISADLGGDDGFARFREALRHSGMGLLLDIVPNHMSTDPLHNPWWGDVLARGRRSAYAHWFDVDWERPGYEGRVTLPVLGDDLDRVLHRGEITVVFERETLWLAYGNCRVPLDPAQTKLDLSDPADVAAENRAASREAAPPSRLVSLLEAVPAALMHSERANQELNYRRFFDVTDLVGVRVEDPEVFDAVHARVLALVRDGAVTGLRVDHPDGLWDPGAYVDRLQLVLRSATSAPVYVLVEKILSPGEHLPDSWRGKVHGTTGYNFLNDVNGVFVDPLARAALEATYTRVTGRNRQFADVLHDAKVVMLDDVFVVELSQLSRQLATIVPAWSRATAGRILRELVACFSVYRTYVTEAGARDADRRVIEAAVAEAVRRRPADAASYARVGRFLTGHLSDAPVPETWDFVGRFQQLTGPVQAKGLEDTACYRDPRLLSLNEVGGAPERFGCSVKAFHQASVERRSSWPLEMLATSTHDTKRGEDARARLNALSEMPHDWDRAVSRWFAINADARRLVDADWAPAPNAEYLYYQALLGSWPVEPEKAPVPTHAPADYIGRVVGYMEKAGREAKERTSWLRPNVPYERAVTAFVHDTLAGACAAGFLAAFCQFQRHVARVGIVNSLAQLVLKLSVPGIPDIYQGTELWDFSFVDPDNRRPVDFDRRRLSLNGLLPWLGIPAPGGGLEDVARGLLARAWDGDIKVFVMARLLGWRRAHADVMTWGDYTPLEAVGSQADRVVAFSRQHEHERVVVVVPRLSDAVTDDDHPYPIGPRAWGDTAIPLPTSWTPRDFHHLLTGATVQTAPAGGGTQLQMADLCRTLPVAVVHTLACAPR